MHSLAFTRSLAAIKHNESKIGQNNYELLHKTFRRDNTSISTWLSLTTLDPRFGSGDEIRKSLNGRCLTQREITQKTYSCRHSSEKRDVYQP